MKKLDIYLLFFVRGGLFLVPFVPLVVSSSLFFPFITGKAFAFRILVEALFAVWVVLALRRPEYRPSNTLFTAALVYFLIVMFLADAFGLNPLKSFWSNYERMEGYIALLHFSAFFLVAGSMFNEEAWWRRFFATSVGVSVVMSFYGMLQLAGKIAINQGGVRLDGTFGNAAYLAAYALLHFFLALYLYVSHRRGGGYGARVFYGIAMALNLFTLYHTATRGAALGLAVGVLLALLVVALFERERPKTRRAAWGLLIACLILGGGLLAIRKTNFVMRQPALSRFVSVSAHELVARESIWRMALKNAREHPLLGTGQETFNFAFNKYYTPELYASEQWFDRTHDFIFDWLVAGGVLGLIGFFLLLFVPVVFVIRPFGAVGSFWQALKRPKLFVSSVAERFSMSEKAVLLGLLAGFMAQDLFIFDNIGTYIFLFSLFGYLHFRAVRAGAQPSGQPLTAERTYRVALPAALALLVAALYFINVRPLLAAAALIDALKDVSVGKDAALVQKDFERALSYKPFAAQEVREQLITAAINVAAGQGSNPATAPLVELAKKEMDTQIARSRNDARHYVFMGSLLNRIGRYDNALTYLSKALDLSPNKQTIMFEVGNAYLGKGDGARALAVLKHAYDLEPEYYESRIIYSAAALYAGKPDIAKGVLEKHFGTMYVDDDRLLRAYIVTKNFGAVRAIWQERVDKNPTNSQFMLSLAAAYLANNERQKAIDALKKVIELNPAFKGQGEQYIKDIRAGKNP